MAAFFVVLINFAISGFAPYFMVLIPAFPFLLLAVFPISWYHVRYPEKHGIIGAGIGAFISTLPATAIFAYDMVTGWKGGADIGLGLLYMFLPLYSVGFMVLGYFIGEIIALIRHRNIQRLPNIFRTISLFIGIGLCFYFLFRCHSAYNLLRYYEKNDPFKYFLVKVHVWEGTSYLIINASSGDIHSLLGIPIISKDLERFVVASIDLEAGYNPNRIAESSLIFCAKVKA